ncbi:MULTISPECIES: MFS transporter [unclassified Streptomyces]|uniref:MFS transporter n=1 Tax=unclassified Streptomyces TaxID=2593676 RepID=UPI000A1EA62E|nr:MFS transporter [Streptomyces sp. 13-12-16]OSP44733.1 MFS transporter [Streptomyces sp. 13-12-16]
MGSTESRAAAPAHSELRRKWPVLAICCTSLFMVGLDTTIVNLALPAIQRDLGATASGLQWTVDAYTVVLACLLLFSGSVADRFGRRRTFQSGLLLFSTASLLCGLAPGTGSLIAFRMLQAVGGAMLNPVAMSIITNTFRDPGQRARAIGIWGGVAGMSLAFGPVVGGTLVDTVGWRAIFWINVPVGLAALLLTVFLVPESRAPRPRRFDPVGQILVAVVLATLTFGIIEGPGKGWGSPLIVGCFAASAVAVTVLVRYERQRHEPLLELRFFADPGFSGAMASAVCGFAALAGFLFLNSLYLQDVRGYSPLHAGMLTLPMAATTLVCGPLAGRIIAARGPRPAMMGAGLGITGCGLLLLGLAADTAVWYLVLAYVLFGAGFGMLDPPLTYVAVSGVPHAQAGVASAFTSTCRQIGATLGIAVLGSVSTARTEGSFATGFPEASHLSWGIMSGCGVTVLLLAVLTMGRRQAASPDPVSDQRDTAPRETPEPGRTGPARPAP